MTKTFHMHGIGGQIAWPTFATTNQPKPLSSLQRTFFQLDSQLVRNELLEVFWPRFACALRLGSNERLLLRGKLNVGGVDAHAIILAGSSQG